MPTAVLPLPIHQLARLGLPVLFLASLASACSGSDLEIVDGPLMGTVFGENWVLAAGHTDEFLSEGDGDFFAILFPE